MMTKKCRKCKHYTLEYVSAFSAYIEGCDAGNLDRGNGCKDGFKEKEKPKAFIKRR